MKTLFNITTDASDLERYPDRASFLQMLDGFDGVELMPLGEDERQVIPVEKVIGIHMVCLPFWVDLWWGNTERCLQEFDNFETMEACCGGTTRNALIARFQKGMAQAAQYGAEYAVFHVCDSSVEETLTGQYHYRDEDVIDATCELINEALSGQTEGPLLLLENLWEPGLTFTRPDMTERLLKGIRYPHVGLMLDTGHLMHTAPSLAAQEDAVQYIHRCLDAHGPLCRYIRGVHLHQSLTGERMLQMQALPPAMLPTYEERMGQVFSYVFEVDRHLPFTCKGVSELVERIAPDYLTYEFISRDRQEHKAMLDLQRQAMHMG